MPELPEVETIKTELAPHIIGRRISGVTVFWDRIVREPSIEEFHSRIIGQQITNVARRGKYLLVSLSSGDLLIIHLKMSGSLLIADSSAEPPKYTQAILSLNNNTRIFFRDPRKFGLMRLVKDMNHVIGKLGPEPLEPHFTPEVLARLLARRTAPIKALLCDQNLIAGVGNMYADEALFLARIHPLRPGRSLTKKEIERLYHAIRKVLVAGIGKKGASVLNYYRPDGTLGTAHFEFKVAHGKGKNCPNCGTPIARLAIRGRGSYFCPRCQPAN